MINSFKDKYRFLSNFFILPEDGYIRWEGLYYPTNEHFYQAMKTIHTKERQEISICQSAGNAKRLGNKIQLRNDWEDIKDVVMEIGLMQKFLLNRKLQKQLLLTSNKRLIEGNYWHDNYWGDCYCKKCKNIPGINRLGKLLMKIRNKLKVL